jgi:predicted ribosome quality control (RQC) complex YloA/Tae2 family protein
MNLEGITLKLLTDELKKNLEGGKIYKIFAPNKDSLLLLINKDNTTSYFLADFTGGSPLVYLPKALPERPDNPSSFCMLLRKHLEEGRITLIDQPGLERMITLHIDMIGANRQIITKHLILELTGKNSNIIFTDENNIIMDATRHIGKSQSSYRQILAGEPYLPPPAQEGLNFLTAAPEEILSAAQKLPGSFVQNLVSATVGIGNNTAEELLLRCQLPLTAATPNPTENATTYATCCEELHKLQAEILSHPNFYGLINKRNTMKLILPYQPGNSSNYQIKVFWSLLEGLRYGASLIPVQIPDKELLTKTVEAALTKAKKKLKFLGEDLAAAQSADKQKIVADTLMAHLYELKKGSTQVELNNIYDNTPLKISLAPQLTPSENAQAYYKKYNKYKRASGRNKRTTGRNHFPGNLSGIFGSLFGYSYYQG